MSLFKRRRFPIEIILLCVRWYCNYGISYRDLAEMMSERGVDVDPSTIFRRFQGSRSGSWRVDETYVRVGGKWKYLFRAVDKHGQLIDFMLSDRRNTRAAYRFLRKALKTMGDCPPSSITTDKLASYPRAICRLIWEGYLAHDVEHRTSKCSNNIIEADHGALKRVIRPTRGFQRMRTAYATLKGIEVMRMIRRGHCILQAAGTTGEIRLVNHLFGLAARVAHAAGLIVPDPGYCNRATTAASAQLSRTPVGVAGDAPSSTDNSTGIERLMSDPGPLSSGITNAFGPSIAATQDLGSIEYPPVQYWSARAESLGETT